MKKFILSVLAIFIATCFAINSQTAQGKFLIGASTGINLSGTNSDLMNFGFNSEKSSGSSSPSNTVAFNLNPKAGYFIIENFVVGLNFNMAYSYHTSGSYTSASTLIGAGPFARFYFPSHKILPFFEANFLLSNISSNYNNGNSGGIGNSGNYAYSMFSFGLGAGIAFSVSEKAAFDLMLGYRRISEGISESKYIIDNLGLNLGFVFYL